MASGSVLSAGRATAMVRAHGGRRRSVPAAPAPSWLATIAAGIAAVIGNALTPLRNVGTSHADRYLPRYLRRRVPHSTCRVERVIIDAWLLWRR